MWYNYKLSLIGSSMSYISKLNIYIVLWAWIDVLLCIAKNESVIEKIIMVIILYFIILFFVKVTKHKTSVDSYIYLKSLLLNKPAIVEYYVEVGNDPKDTNKWDYKI